MKRVFESRFLRFVVMGGLNTAITYGIFLLCHLWLGHQASYAIAYVCGIVLSYFINATVVFRTAMSLRSFGLYPLVYLVQYGVGAIVLELAIRVLNVPTLLAPLLGIAASIPVTFVLARWVLSGRHSW